MDTTLDPTLPTAVQERRPRQILAPNGQQLNASWIQIPCINGGVYFHHPENGVITLADPRDPANAEVLQTAAHRILPLLAQSAEPGSTLIVLGFTDEMRRNRRVSYYLVNDGDKRVFWLEDVPGVIFRVTSDRVHTENCRRPFHLHQYWHHVHHFPPATVNVAAEEELLWRLSACQIIGNENLSPWTPDECLHYIAAVVYNRSTKPERVRMAELGLLWSLIYRDQHERLHGRNQGINPRHRNGGPVAFVERPHQDQPDWALLVQILIDIDRPVAIIVAYSVVLAGANKYVGPEQAFNDLFFLASLTTLTAILLLCVFSPRLYLYAVRVFFDDRAGAALARNWLLTPLLAFDALVYGCLLEAVCRCLASPEHQIPMAGLVLVTLVLALLPAFHVLRSEREIG